jgi:hypothetical protein
MKRSGDCTPLILYATCGACYKPNYANNDRLALFDPALAGGRQGWYITCGSCGAAIPVSDEQARAVGKAISKERAAR